MPHRPSISLFGRQMEGETAKRRDMGQRCEPPGGRGRFQFFSSANAYTLHISRRPSVPRVRDARYVERAVDVIPTAGLGRHSRAAKRWDFGCGKPRFFVARRRRRGPCEPHGGRSVRRAPDGRVLRFPPCLACVTVIVMHMACALGSAASASVSLGEDAIGLAHRLCGSFAGWAGAFRRLRPTSWAVAADEKGVGISDDARAPSAGLGGSCQRRREAAPMEFRREKANDRESLGV